MNFGAGNVTVLQNQWCIYATSFRVRETDQACGPGTYALTLLSLAVSRVSSPTATLNIGVFSADAATGVPGSPVSQQMFVSDPVPPTLGYMVIPHSSLLTFDTGSFLFFGASYSLLISSAVALNLHSATSGTVNNIPISGAADVYASYFSANAPGYQSCPTAVRGS